MANVKNASNIMQKKANYHIAKDLNTYFWILQEKRNNFIIL